MLYRTVIWWFLILLSCIVCAQSQSYEDVRCKCVCPNPSVVNVTQSNRKLYIRNVPPNQCGQCKQQAEAAQTTGVGSICAYELGHAQCSVLGLNIIRAGNCDNVILPQVGDEIKGKEQEFCPRCECKYESRNTSIIKYVVIIVIWIISLLVIYMLFLICLDPLLNKRVKGSYQEHNNEEDEPSTSVDGTTSHVMGVRGNVLNRVGHQQDKWKRQVREQRRNIYDRHTMLN